MGRRAVSYSCRLLRGQFDQRDVQQGNDFEFRGDAARSYLAFYHSLGNGQEFLLDTPALPINFQKNRDLWGRLRFYGQLLN